MKQNGKIREFLFSLPLLEGLSKELTCEYYIEEHQKSDIIFYKHKGIQSLGILYQGQLSISNVAIDGNELLLSNIYPKDFFGLCNLLSALPLPVPLKCSCPSTIIYIPKEEFIRLMAASPSLMMRIMEFYNQKILSLQKKIELLNISSPTAKVCFHILSNINERNEFHFTCSKREFCSQIGIGRASLYRGLEEMKKLSCLEVKGNKVTVKNVDEFQRYISAAC